MLLQSRFVFYCALSLGISSNVPAAVVSPALITAEDVSTDQIIDPIGSSSIIAFGSGSTSQGTLEAIAGFSAVHSYPTAASDKSNIFDLSGPIDFQTTASGDGTSRSGNARPSNNGFQTSGEGFIVVESDESAAPVQLFVIDFGVYNSGTEVFDTASGVAAAAFTLTSSTGGWDDMEAVVATFKNISGDTLSSQNLGDPSGLSGGATYFGYQSSGEAIGSIELQITYTSGGKGTAGLDDIGFVPVPEPGTVGLMLLGGLLVPLRRR